MAIISPLLTYIYIYIYTNRAWLHLSNAISFYLSEDWVKVILTTLVWVTFLGFLSWPQVLLDASWSTAGWRGIGAGPWAFLRSSTTSHTAFSPVWPFSVAARYSWKEIAEKSNQVCCWVMVDCRLVFQKVILTTLVWVTFLGFLGGSQVLLDAGWSAARWRRIGACPWAFLDSSTTCCTTLSPIRPASVTTRHR